MDGTEENGAPSLFISMSVSKVHTPNDLARQTVAGFVSDVGKQGTGPVRA